MKHSWHSIILSMVIIIPFANTLFAQSEKFDLSILVVGTTIEKGIPESIKKKNAMGEPGYDKIVETYGSRVVEFKELLDQYFPKVVIVDCKDYLEEMSGDFDVTIFDKVPTPIQAVITEYDEDGQLTKYEGAHYVTDEYDHATIFISETADRIGRSLGSKLDWLCLCLDKDAHHMNLEHPIFNTPIKVDLTIKVKPTPEEIYHYDSGDDVPKELPMWEVQTEGYEDGNGYRIGMVSRGNGFLDSPDAEYISSGVCLKDVGAVALGRHASFFLWGFSGSPDYMTEEAKKVFVNSVVYISKFKGVKPIARKGNDRVVIRDGFIDRIIKSATEEGYIKTRDYYAELEVDNMKRKKNAEEKQAAGEKLSSAEKYALRLKKSEPLTWEAHLKDKMGVYADQFGTDDKAFRKFMTDNREYFYWEDRINNYSLTLDKEAQSLGIPNRDVKILKECAKLLVKEEQVELAKKVLARYTNENFETAKEWKKWVKRNEKKLFFSESAGYKWLVNTL